MIQTYKIQCGCGSDLVIQLDSGCPFVRLYCQKCKAVLYSHKPVQETQRRTAEAPRVLESKTAATGSRSSESEITDTRGSFTTPKPCSVQSEEPSAHAPAASAPAAKAPDPPAHSLPSSPPATPPEAPKGTPPSGVKVSSPIDHKTTESAGPRKTGPVAARFANYTVIKSLGEGAMGKVYLGVDELSGEKVALKIMQKPDNTKDLEYFLREAQVLLQLHHPNIVRLRGRGNYNGFPYIAMEYMEGKTLDEVLDQGPIGPARAAQIIYDVLSALEYAAQFQIIHRDIKPANIFLATDGQTKIIDMGMGKVMDDAYGSLTKTGQAMGTPYYMPLEQILDAKRADYRSDIYAVGSTLYHALSGVPPYDNYKKNLQTLLRAKMSHKCTPLSEVAPRVPRELVAIVDKAMAHSPADRYAGAKEMKEAIEKFFAKTMA